MRLCSVALCALLPASLAAQENVPALIAKIKALGTEGKGNAEAAKAWKQLVAAGPEAAFELLTALDDTDDIAANWIRSAADAIADNAMRAGKRLSQDRLESFVKDLKRSGAGRRLAYDWLVRLDPAAPKRLLPAMLDDPGAELRREAVAVVVDRAEDELKKGNKAAATAAYQKVLEHARDADQVQKAAKELAKLGVDVDLTRQFGFITSWHLVGPFDNVKNVGFTAPYPPEKGFDLKAAFDAKDGKKAGWQAHTTDLAMGVVDLNKLYGPLKGAIVYGHAVVESPTDQAVEIRVGSFNAVRIYLNGKEVYFRNEYHHGMNMDQHVAKTKLKAGRSEVLIKVCQNEQTESWATNWSFQMRITDAIGGPAPVTMLDAKK